MPLHMHFWASNVPCGPTNQRIRMCRPCLSVAYSYLQLYHRISWLTDCKFTIRMLYTMYTMLFINFYIARPTYCFIFMYTCGLTVVIKGIDPMLCYVTAGYRLRRPKLTPVSLISMDTIRYDTRCCFSVRSKADMSQLNLPHGTDNKKV